MFDFIRRLFGAGTPDALDSPPRTVATIDVEDRNGARGRLVARDAAGASLLATNVAMGISPSLAARLGAVWETVSAREGDYLIETVLPARTDEAGMALFGSHPMLRLRAMTGRTFRPGRMLLLIHGGPADRPTDGSIRMDDADLGALLALLPPDPGTVRVRLTRPAGDADDAGAGWDDGWQDDASPYYGQLYAWDGTAPDSPPYADIPAGDEAVGPALAGLGYTVLSDTGTPAASAAETAGAAAADAGLSTLSGDGGWSPAGGAYGP